MRKALGILIILLLLPFSLKAQGQTITAKPYGQACMSIPTSGSQDYKLRWARLGADYNVSNKGTGKVEADFTSNTLVMAYLQKDFGHGLTLAYGKQLTPMTALYPGSRGRQLTQAPHMFDGSTCFAVGLQATWTGKGITARAMQFGHDQWSGAISSHGLSLFWEEDVLAGTLFESPWTTPLLHPSIGFGSRAHGLTTVTIQNFWQATPSVRVYAQADLRDNQNAGLLGISYEHSKLCFLRLFREVCENAQARWAAEATFAF